MESFVWLCWHTFINCMNGTYGNNCSNTCGHCLNDGHCFHVNGTFPLHLGCDSGYTGDLCNISYLTILYRTVLFVYIPWRYGSKQFLRTPCSCKLGINVGGRSINVASVSEAVLKNKNTSCSWSKCDDIP